MNADAIEILLNGKPHEVVGGSPLTNLLDELGMKVGVLIEYNDRALLPKEWAGVTLSSGDRVEIIRIVAGG